MSRIIQTDGVGKRRTQLLKAIVISIRELMKQTSVNSDTRDLAAFISNALLAVHETVEESVIPWEKRGYWVKADKFRLEWEWTKNLGEEMLQATKDEDWPSVAALSANVGQQLSSIQVSDRHRMGKPWVGAWDLMKKR
ncbi:hypothetical protein KQH54_02055 [bacterium]|nr:hypothetical protein [bacterium]